MNLKIGNRLQLYYKHGLIKYVEVEGVITKRAFMFHALSSLKIRKHSIIIPKSFSDHIPTHIIPLDNEQFG